MEGRAVKRIPTELQWFIADCGTHWPCHSKAAAWIAAHPPRNPCRKQNKSPSIAAGAFVFKQLTVQSVDHGYHVRQLGNRTAHFGSVFQLHHAVHLAQPQANQNLLLAFGATDRRTDLLDLDLCHVS